MIPRYLNLVSLVTKQTTAFVISHHNSPHRHVDDERKSKFYIIIDLVIVKTGMIFALLRQTTLYKNFHFLKFHLDHLLLFLRYAVSTRWEREVAEHGPVQDFHRYCCCFARRLGNMFILCERPDGSPIVVAGPCWPFCTFVTLPLILAVSGAVSYFIIISPDSPLVSGILRTNILRSLYLFFF